HFAHNKQTVGMCGHSALSFGMSNSLCSTGVPSGSVTLIGGSRYSFPLLIRLPLQDSMSFARNSDLPIELTIWLMLPAACAVDHPRVQQSASVSAKPQLLNMALLLVVGVAARC